MARIQALASVVALCGVACSFELTRSLTTGELRGRAVVGTDGTPAAGAIVRLDGVAGQARTDSSGRFTFRRLPAERIGLRISWDATGDGTVDAGIALRNIELGTASGGARDLGTLQLGALSTLEATLSDAAGPVAQPLATLSGVDTLRFEGTVRFTNLLPGAAYTLAARATEEGPLAVATELVLEPGETRRVDLSLVGVPESRLSLGGRVLGPSPLAGARIRLVPGVESTVGDGGLYTLTDVPRGVYTLEATLEGRVAARVPDLVLADDDAVLPDLWLLPGDVSCGQENTLDSDSDGLGDACDACPDIADPDSPDRNADGRADACHPIAVVIHTPAPGATAVARDSIVQVEFTRPVAATATPALRAQGVAFAPGQLENGRILRFRPSPSLPAATTITVTLEGLADDGGNTLAAVSWTFTTAAPTFAGLQLDSLGNSYVSGGSTASLTVTLLDETGLPLGTGTDTVTLEATTDHPTRPAVIGDNTRVVSAIDGVATFGPLVFDAPGATTLTASVSGAVPPASQAVTVAVNPTVPDDARTTVNASSTPVVADGVAVCTVTTNVRNGFDAPMASFPVGFATTGSANTGASSPVSTNGAGFATWQLSTTRAEVKQVTVTFGPFSRVVSCPFVGGQATSLAFATPIPGFLQRGVPFAVRIVARDPFGNDTANVLPGPLVLAATGTPTPTCTTGCGSHSWPGLAGVSVNLTLSTDGTGLRLVADQGALPQLQSRPFVVIAPFVAATGITSTNGGDAAVISPVDPNVVYVGLNAAPGVLKSTDGGRTFTALANQPGGESWNSFIDLHPTDVNIVFAGNAFTNVWKSVDGGATWSAANNGLFGGNGSVTGVHHIPGTASSFLARPHNGRLFRSDDTGDSWFEVGPDTDQFSISRVTIDPTNPARWFLTNRDTAPSNPPPMTWITTDSGATWTNPTGLPVPGMSLMAAYSPTVPGLALLSMEAGSAPGLYRSTDGGASWSILPGLGASLAVRFASNGDAWASFDGGLYYSSDGGDSWTLVLAQFVRFIGIDPANPFHVVTSGGGTFVLGAP